MVCSIKICTCAVVQKDVRLPKSIRGYPDVLGGLVETQSHMSYLQKSLTDKDLLNETKLAYIDVVVLRFIPAHERVIPGHCQPGSNRIV